MNWDHWRREFPITERLTHFNHAGVAPLSRRVAAAVAEFVSAAMRIDAEAQRRWGVRSEEVRAAFAQLVGAQSDEIAFVKNTSEGLSLVAAGLDWHVGDNVIAVDGEYPSNVYPWFGLRRFGVETRLVSVSFVDWGSGARTDLAAIASVCHDRGVLFCVDGIQGVGAVRLDVERAGIDCLAVGGHKWLLAPEGLGCLYVSRRVVDRIASVLHGWKSVTDADTYLPYHFTPRPDAAKFEPGSPSVLSAYALGAAIDMLLEVGPAAVEARIGSLTDRLADGLRRRGADVLSPWGADERSGIVVFRLGDDPQTLCRALIERGFIVRVRSGGIRVAPHFYNNADDIDRFLAVLEPRRR